MWKAVGGVIGALAAGLSLFWIGYQMGRSSLPDGEVDTEIARTYEWQWAGENWYSRLRIEKDAGGYVIPFAKVA